MLVKRAFCLRRCLSLQVAFAKLAQVSEAQIWLELIKVDFSQGGDFETGNMKVNKKS